MTSAGPLGVVIIGGGCSGALVAVQLLRQATPLVVHVVEPSPHLCQGVAYSTQFDCHLLNVPAQDMSAFPDDSSHFLRWLERHPELTRSLLPNGIHPTTFVPRQLYGTYLQTLLNEAEAKAASDVDLVRIQDEAIAIEPQPHGARVHLRRCGALQVQKVVLALGNFRPTAPPVETPEFYNSDRYVHSAWSPDALSGLNADDAILLIGSSLTMVDQVLTLQQQGWQGKIYSVSRHGLLPQPHISGSKHAHFPPHPTPTTARVLFHSIRAEVRAAATRGEDWQNVVDSLRPVTRQLWQTLSEAERRRFLRHVRSYWDIHRHRIAPEIAAVLDELRNSQQLVVCAGRIQAYHEGAAGVDVIIRQRHTQEIIKVRVNRVINCTGPTSNYSKLQHPLINNLRAQGLLVPDALGLGIRTAPNGDLLSLSGTPSNWLYTLGVSRKADLWETVAVPEIRVQAAHLAQELLIQPAGLFMNSRDRTTVVDNF